MFFFGLIIGVLIGYYLIHDIRSKFKAWRINEPIYEKTSLKFANDKSDQTLKNRNDNQRERF